MSALRKVLVVDDDPVVGKSFNRVLTDEKGYIVVTAKNAHEALKKIREERYDVVFTDIKMPGMDGVELAERVKSRQPWIPVVIVTGYGTVDNEDRAKAAGVSAFLRKPLSPEMIEESAHDALMQPVARPVVHGFVADATEPSVQATPLANRSNAKGIALAMVSPFIGLAFAVLMPLVGLATLAWVAASAMAAKPLVRKLAVHLKNIVLFLAAPFIGLAYALSLPLVGVGMLAWVGWQAFAANPKNAKTAAALKQTGLFIAAPFIGLAFAVMLPLVGTGMLAWVGIRGLMPQQQVQ
jgi:CheY-like chemotaxis protein